MPDALVTGGCGFIGRHLVRGLLARGNSIRVLDLAGSACLPPEVEFVQGSILDPTTVAQAMDGVRHVYHLAGIPHLWTPRRADFALVNARGTDIVLRAAAQQRIERVVHCSTEAVLLPKHGSGTPVDESLLPPLSDMAGPYTRSKHQAETLAVEAARQSLDVVVVNPTVPVGADDDNLTPPTAMMELFLNGRAPFFLDCVLNLVDVRAVAAGIILAAERGRRGERYILDGENVALRDLLRVLGGLSGRSMPKRSIPAPVAFASAVAAEWIADRVTSRRPPATREGVRLALRSAPFQSRKAQAELGYEPRPAGEAVREAVQWLCARRAQQRAAMPSTGRAAALNLRRLGEQPKGPAVRAVDAAVERRRSPEGGSRR